MDHFSIYSNKNFIQAEYERESELTETFSRHYTNIFSKKSYFINRDTQFKTKNFKNSRCDGFVFVWENPHVPKLYIAEMELGRHGVDRHILPQIGGFISFIKINDVSEIIKLQKIIYNELEANKKIFEQIQSDTKKEVYKLIETALEDLQILMVIDRTPADLTIGLSQIEKVINVKIRKIELVRYKESKNKSDELIYYSDNEPMYEDEVSNEGEINNEEDISVNKNNQIQYFLDYHLNGKSEKVVQLFDDFVEIVKDKLKITPKKLYISFVNQHIIFSLVVMTKKIMIYSKEPATEINPEYKLLAPRDVTSIGHWASHQPTEIKLDGSTDFKLLKKYVFSVIDKYGGALKNVDNSEVLDRG